MHLPQPLLAEEGFNPCSDGGSYHVKLQSTVIIDDWCLVYIGFGIVKVGGVVTLCCGNQRDDM